MKYDDSLSEDFSKTKAKNYHNYVVSRLGHICVKRTSNMLSKATMSDILA